VLPTFEDVLGVGESEGDYTSGLEIDEDFVPKLLVFRIN
jgi:hypothetical protein